MTNLDFSEDVYVFPTSFAQQRLWFLDQFTPGNPVYNTRMTVRLTGALSLTALEKSLNELVKRHEILRTSFSQLEGEAVQVVTQDSEFSLPPVSDWRLLSASEREVQLQHFIAQEHQRAFDLEKGPLWRLTLLCLAEQEHLLLIVRHHIITDAWSNQVFFRELATLYEAFCLEMPSPLPELPIQYADFAIWQREALEGEELQRQLAYWKAQLGGELPILALPTDHPRPPVQSYRGASDSWLLSTDLTQALKRLSLATGSTLFITLLSVFKTLLYRYSAQEEIIVGTPIANRNRAELEGLIGFFLNTLVLRTSLQGNPTFSDLAARVRQVAATAYAHQDIPFEKLVEELESERDMSRSPLFQVMFTFNENNEETRNLSTLTMIRYRQPSSSQTAKFDLTLNTSEQAEQLRLTFNYNTDLFEAATIKRMAGHFQTLLEGIIANPETPISELPLLTESERHQLLVEWNNTATDYPSPPLLGGTEGGQCVHRLFEAQVERTPDAIALIFGEEQLSYRTLNERANQLAHYLIKLGVEPEVKVGICVERSIEMVVGLLGILKAGGAYVPLEPTDPKERLAFILKDSSVTVLLTQSHLKNQLPPTAWPVIVISESLNDSLALATNPSLTVSSTNQAYICYTSGSTGQPKGVIIEHRSVVRLVKNTNYVSLTSDEIFLQLAPLSFDASTFEIWGALLNGAQLVIMPPATPSLTELAAALKRYRVSTLWLTAGLFHLMVEQQLEALLGVRQLLAGGDVLSLSHVQKLLSNPSAGTLINGYGPTENTTFTCCYRMNKATQLGLSVPIGRPIANTQVYILDEHQNPVPIGVPGTLYIGGDGLARGYLNQPELTAERFVDNPVRVGSRLYNSGDQARWLSDGNIEFLGRKDHQVKIRGFRIELGEIEAALNSHPAVREVVVVARESEHGDKQLVAYVVSSSTPSVLRAYLASKLPNYMIPSAFVPLEALPLTPNGKIDRRALPAPTPITAKSSISKPRTLTEEMLSRIWVEVLGLEVLNYGTSEVDVEQNFFEAGGHSLSAVQLMSRIHSTFNIQLPLASLFEFPTIAGLARCLSERREQVTNDYQSLRPIRTGGKRPPFFLVPGGEGDESTFMLYAKWLYLLGSEPPIYGFYARGLDGYQPPHSSVAEMAADYVQEMRTLQRFGPYFLGGECIGGKVAFEMGRQLQAQGQEVALLLLMDTAFSHQSHLGQRLYNRLRRLLKETLPRHLTALRPLSPKEQITYAASKLALLLPNRERMRVQLAPKSEEDKRLAHQIKVQKHYLNLLMQHQATEPYSGRVTLIYSGERQRNTSIKGWQSLASEGYELFTVPGTHREYLGANVQTTAAQVRHCLEAAYRCSDNLFNSSKTGSARFTEAPNSKSFSEGL